MRTAGSGKGVRLSFIYTLILVLCSLLRATGRSRILGKIHSENLSPLLGRIQWVRKTKFTRAKQSSFAIKKLAPMNSHYLITKNCFRKVGLS